MKGWCGGVVINLANHIARYICPFFTRFSNVILE